MKIGFLNEQADPRVSLIPAVAAKYTSLGVELLLEKGAGAAAYFPDEAYGEDVRLADRSQVLREADVLVSIHPLPDSELQALSPNMVVVSEFAPFRKPDVVDELNGYKLRAFSLDMIPRTTLAQSMDVLSSMASIAGYRAVLEAGAYLPRYFPMLITAAGSIRPAKVLVLGAGVAGLQAIATAKRLGAQVEASDTRLAAKEEVLSLGAKFVEVEGARDDTEAGGYAVEQSEEFLERQRAEVQARAAKADVIITTAQVRGNQAPVLLPASTVEKMQPGSVIVDLAASTGGNCELTKDQEVIEVHGVTIIGNSNLAAKMPQDASILYSNNVLNFLKTLIREGELHVDMENEIVRGALITAPEEVAQ